MQRMLHLTPALFHIESTISSQYELLRDELDQQVILEPLEVTLGKKVVPPFGLPLSPQPRDYFARKFTDLSIDLKLTLGSLIGQHGSEEQRGRLGETGGRPHRD